MERRRQPPHRKRMISPKTVKVAIINGRNLTIRNRYRARRRKMKIKKAILERRESKNQKTMRKETSARTRMQMKTASIVTLEQRTEKTRLYRKETMILTSKTISNGAVKTKMMSKQMSKKIMNRHQEMMKTKKRRILMMMKMTIESVFKQMV